MILFLHGYLLGGSGSNLWTRHIVENLGKLGLEVVLGCQEPHPEAFPFIRQVSRIDRQGAVHQSQLNPLGTVDMIKAELGELLPVYVRDQYEEFKQVVPFTELGDTEIAHYVETNLRALRVFCKKRRPSHIIANHTIMISEVARQLAAELSIPYSVVPHGSALEYAVVKDDRLKQAARTVLAECSRIFLVAPEIGERLGRYFPGLSLPSKLHVLAVGVDTGQFALSEPAERGNLLTALAQTTGKLPPGRPLTVERSLEQQVASGFTDPKWRTPNYPEKYPDQGLSWEAWDKDAPTAIFVGRLLPAKGIHCLIEAWARVLKTTPDAQLIVVGHGPYRETAQALALTQGAKARQTLWELEAGPYFPPVQGGEDFPSTGSRIRFTGFLNHEALASLLPCADVAVVPSLVPEAGPMVLLEAAACGCFPMGVDQGGMAGNLDAISVGVPLEVRSVMKLSPDPAQLVADLATHIPEAFRIGPLYKEAIRKTTQDRFDWKVIAKKLAEELAT